MSRVAWLFLDLNSFFASCEQQDDPTLRGKPVAVVPSLTDTTSVIAASYAAKAFGIRTGTRVREAKQMCPGLILRTGNHKRYVQHHNAVKRAIEDVLPIEMVCSVDEFACRLMGDECEVREAIALAECVKQSIRQKAGEALTCSIGLAPNRFLGKVAADMQKPDGLTVISLDDIPGKLLRLKLQDFPGIGPRMAQRLINQGVTTVEQLYAADIPTMRALWGGIEGEKFYQKLRGEDPFYRATETGSFSHQHVLEPKFRSMDGVSAYAQHLLLKLAERLRDQQYLSRRLSLVIRYAGTFQRAHAETSFHETADSLTLLRALKDLLAQMPRGKPFKVAVTVSDLIPAARRQLDLFTDEQESELSTALDDINQKYGRGTLYFGATQALQKHLHARIAFQRVPDEQEFDARDTTEREFQKHLNRISAIEDRRRGG
ncbi:MAG: helix-hairpin-helix domain-containing protein [Bdellovibrionales bacterium]